MIHRRIAPSRLPLRPAYVLLETVVATGLLIVGLAVIGAQIQSADTSVRTMERKVRAVMLAEQQLAELDLGLVELESLDEVEEGDFGSRHPDWGWIMTTEPTAVEGMFRLRLDIYYLVREDDYQEDDFDYDEAESVFTVYAFRAAPRPIDFAADFGLNDEQLEELSEKLTASGVAGLDPSQFDPAFLARLPFEDFISVLPTLLDAFGIDFDDLASALPRDVLEQLKEAGVFDEGGEEQDDDGARGGAGNFGGDQNPGGGGQ